MRMRLCSQPTHPRVLPSLWVCLFVIITTTPAVANDDTFVLRAIEPSAWHPDFLVLTYNLGTDDCPIATEGFEAALHPDLNITIEDRTLPPQTTTSSVAWDGDRVLENVGDDQADGKDVTFVFDSPVTRFAIGISHAGNTTGVWVNGVLICEDIRDIPGMTGADFDRTGYLWIEPAGAEPITSVTLDCTPGDYVLFDHVAWTRYSVEGLDASNYSSDFDELNMSLGSDPNLYEIETLEGVVHPDLSIVVENRTGDPQVITNASLAWDFERVMENVADNQADGQTVTFILRRPTARFGFGISHLGGQATIYVNGEPLVFDVTTIDGIATSTSSRSGFLWIEALEGECIETITIDTSDSDYVVYDHICWKRSDAQLGMTVEGNCPGPMTVSVSDATPGSNVAVLYALGPGDTVIPGGFTCAGTMLGLDATVRIGGTTTADADGDASFSQSVPPGACGRVFIQAIESATCGTSNTARL